MLVRFHSLIRSPELNGTYGRVKGVKEQRFVVETVSGRTVIAKATNIVPSASHHVHDVLRKAILVKTTPDGEILAYGFWIDMQHIDPFPEEVEVWECMHTKSTTAYEAHVPAQCANMESIMVDGPNGENLAFILMSNETKACSSKYALLDAFLVEIVWRKSDGFIASLHRQAYFSAILPSQTQLRSKLICTLRGEAQETRHVLMAA